MYVYATTPTLLALAFSALGFRVGLSLMGHVRRRHHTERACHWSNHVWASFAQASIVPCLSYPTYTRVPNKARQNKMGSPWCIFFVLRKETLLWGGSVCDFLICFSKTEKDGKKSAQSQQQALLRVFVVGCRAVSSDTFPPRVWLSSIHV